MRRILSFSMKWLDLAKRTKNTPLELPICNLLSKPKFNNLRHAL